MVGTYTQATLDLNSKNVLVANQFVRSITWRDFMILKQHVASWCSNLLSLVLALFPGAPMSFKRKYITRRLPSQCVTFLTRLRG